MSHSFERIAKQVDEHLLDLDAVHQDLIVLWIEVEPKLHALLAGAGETERAGFLNQFGESFDALFIFTPCHEISQPPNDLSGTNCLFGGAVERAFNLRSVRVCAGR